MKKTSNRRTPRDAYLRQSKNSAAMHGVPSAILIDQGFDRSTRSFMDPKRRRPLEPAFDLDPEEEDIPTPSRVPDQDAMAAVVGAALDAVVSPGRPAASSTMSREIVDPKRLFERQQDVDSRGGGRGGGRSHRVCGGPEIDAHETVDFLTRRRGLRFSHHEQVGREV